MHDKRSREAARRAYKREWERKKAARQREQDGRVPETDPQIPGLLPIWRDRYRIVDFARVDLDDWENLRHRHFTLAVGYPAVGSGRNRRYLHHLLLGDVAKGSGLQADHINRDKLDNRRANLRVVTTQENQHNRGGVYERCWWRQQQAA